MKGEGGERKIVYFTAGAGGMFCGSCLNDNTLARGLTGLGADVQLVPTYTPIHTDEEDVSVDQVFFGGINVFLQQKFPPFRYLPRFFDRLLNHPQLIRWATRRDVQADPELLGAMTVSMLRGRAGFQRKEQARLLDFLDRERPDVVNFTNVLIAGSAPEIRRRLGIPIVVTLQGDDIFLDYLPERYADEATAQIRTLHEVVDAYVVHSQFYADAMRDRLGIPADKLHVVPLGIDAADFASSVTTRSDGMLRVGYLARLTPEKGLHVMVDAFIHLRQRRQDVRLDLAGWLGTEHQGFADEQFAKLHEAGLGDDFHYHGVIDRQDKVDFLRNLDVFAVPTTYQEPKGRFALEAMACGVPLVLPAHGAFPELIEESEAGVLVPPESPAELAAELDHLLSDAPQRSLFGRNGQRAVSGDRSALRMAERTLAVYQHVLAAAGMP